MSQNDPTPSFLRRLLAVAIIYLIVIGAILSVVVLRLQARGTPSPSPAIARSAATPTESYKPYFSLSSNRLFNPTERARFWINYVGINHLDFRVYRVNDPAQFFKQLKNPHGIGQEKELEMTTIRPKERTPSALERLRAFKVAVTKAIKNYFRTQLKTESRQSFNQKFRSDEDRAPLNLADYARVPLLNPDQLVSSWREPLPPSDTYYDSRMIPLGKREPGFYLVEAVNGDLRAYTITIVTNLTMIDKVGRGNDILVYAVDRTSGAPRENVRVEVLQGKQTVGTGATDRSGLARIRATRREGGGDTPYLILARDGDHFAISNPYLYTGGGDSELTGYIYTDRPLYRPAQKIFFKGILRQRGENDYEIVRASTVNVRIEDPTGGKLIEKSLPLSARGTFSGEVETAATAPLGGYSIVASVGGAQARGYFEVQEYKKPEYEVTVKAPKRFVETGETVTFSVQARYFFGEPVSQAEVTYYIYRSRYYPWWWYDEEEDIESEEGEGEGYYGYGNDMVRDGEGELDAQGRMEIEFEVPPAGEKDYWDYTYRVEVQVTDKSRRTISGRTNIIGVRSNVVANMSLDRYVYYEGDPARIRIQTSDYEGRPVATDVTLQFVERRWQRIQREDKSFEYTLQERELTSAGLKTDKQGQLVYDYRVPGSSTSIYIKAVVNDGKKSFVASENYLWVADRSDRWADWTYPVYGAIKLVPDKKSYRPGETAKVMAMLPTDNAHLLVTTESAEVMTAREVAVAGRMVMIEVPIEARHLPGVYLSVSYVSEGEMYTHDKLLPVPAEHKKLSIEILADKSEYKPGETARYTVVARHADGSPASGAEVSVGVVDEAIYSLLPDRAGDIQKVFYGRRYNQVQTSFSMSYYFAGYAGEKPAELSFNRRAYQLADFKEQDLVEAVVRKNFKDTAYWQPDLVTDSDGKATFEVPLPDNLTTWRATARAVTADTRVGSSVMKVIARKNLILRLETPRFLTEGDTATLSAIVHNYLETDKAAQISIEVEGARLLDQMTTRATVAKRGEHRVDWRVTAERVGEVKLLAKALTDEESDAIQISIPIVPHGVEQAKGQAIALADANADQTLSLDLPATAHPLARSLRIEVSPSIAGTLLGALDYLTSYPYGCTEQTMSSFLPNVIVARTLREVSGTTIGDPNELAKKVMAGMKRLYGFQHNDGGWGWWLDDQSDPFMTAYVVDGLVMAKRAGYPVEAERIENGARKLAEMLDSAKTDPNQRAYMVYALIQSGNPDDRHLNGLFADRAKLGPYARALLALSLAERGNTRAAQVAAEIEHSAQASELQAYWNVGAQYGFHTSDVEATALSLKALARLAPRSPLLVKTARWLVTNRRNGYYWDSTKDTAFALLGLTEYLKVSKELSPDYTVEVYLNGEQVVSRRMTAAEVRAARPVVIERTGEHVASANQVRVVKRGSGVVYVSMATSYYTGGDEIAAQASPTLTVTREYLRLSVVERGGQLRWETSPLTGDVRSGDLIAVRLRLRGASSRQIIIEDPIPSGAEQVGQVGGLVLDYSIDRWSDWYSTREFRDQKTVLFVNYFDGDAMFQYALRVQVPGQFRAAPARAELMYDPSVWSNTTSAKMTIVEKK